MQADVYWLPVRIHLIALSCLFVMRGAAQSALGIFESQTDVGNVPHPGAAEFAAETGAYTLTGGGEDIRGAGDNFHFVWKKISGDVGITASIAFPESTGAAHKTGSAQSKGALMIRRSLDSDSEYVDAALYLSGMAALQSRAEAGGVTRQIQSYISKPKSLRLVKTGANFYIYFADEDEVFHLAGGSMKLALAGTFYVGLAAWADDMDGAAKVVFSNVEVKPLPPGGGKPVLYSTLEYSALEVGGTDRRAVFVAKGKFEAPHWSKDGKTLYFTRDGRIFRIPAAGGQEPEPVDTGNLKRIGSHTGISPDGTTLAVTDHEQIYLLPVEGGEPQLVARESSEFCDWPPGGKTILLTGIRNFERLLLTVPAAGGPEKIIPVRNRPEDPVWSPNGQYLYFDSVSGQVGIWRIQPDGSHGESMIHGSKFIDSSPQISPDGKQMALLSRDLGLAMLRLMDLETKAIRIAALFPNSQGELGIEPWSPDSKFIAFVSYQTAPF